MISARNFIRALGGAIGLAISTAIYSSSLHSHLPANLPASITNSIRESTFATPNLTDVDDLARGQVLDAYLSASNSVFIMWVAVIGVCVVLMIFVKDKGLQRKEEQVEEGRIEESERNVTPNEKESIAGGVPNDKCRRL